MKIVKYCSNCGKPLFKYWISKVFGDVIFLKLETFCLRECGGDKAFFNTVELKVDLQQTNGSEPKPATEVTD